MDEKTAYYTIEELLKSINKWYFDIYQDAMDAIRENIEFSEDIQKENEDRKDNQEIAYDEIAELYDYIEDKWIVEKEYILEKLAKIQNYCKRK